MAALRVGLGLSSGWTMPVENIPQEVVPLSWNSPQRRIALIGDSRTVGEAFGQYAPQTILRAQGTTCFKPEEFVFAMGGDRLSDMVSTYAPAALASGARLFVFLDGVNSISDPLGTRQADFQSNIDILDVTGAAIVVCNEMPTRGNATHAGFHDWLDDLTNLSAINATLIRVDTWAAVNDPAPPTYLKPEWANDGLHPSSHGQERQAQAVANAIVGHFGADTACYPNRDADYDLIGAPKSTTGNNGNLPTGWSDFSNTEITYTTVSNGSGGYQFNVTGPTTTDVNMAVRVPLPPIVSGRMLIEFEVPENSGLMSSKLSLRNTSFGSNYNILAKWLATGAEPAEMGGRRQVIIDIGAVTASGRVDLEFDLGIGTDVVFHRIAVWDLV